MASDGGLYIPEQIPRATAWESWKDLSFSDLAYEIMSLYISQYEIPSPDLRDLVNRSYSTFRSDQVTPLVQLDGNHYLLELFHGPTFAFKDVALQFVGNLFEYFLARKNEGKVGRGMVLCQLYPVNVTEADALPLYLRSCSNILLVHQV